MGLKAAVQALKKAEELKARVSRHSDLLNNSEVWSDQQQLQTVYHQVLVLDLEYALDKKVEQELWTLGFKNHIAALQHLSRDKKNPRRSECQALLSWCLEAASGFYLTLLQELCSAFELDLPFRRRGALYGQTKTCPNSEQLTQPHKSSCLYICQYCLVHLGDIARYRSQRKQAESFYRHAILLSPSSGQPYNQVALLEASRGDKLATVFHYVRSISVKHPFPAAATNLSNTLSAVIDNDDNILSETHSKLSLTEFINIFLRVHGLLHLATDLDQAELCVKSLNATFTALVATQAFSSMKLIQMTAINLYALRHTVDSFSTSELSVDELRVKSLVLDLLAGAFSAYLLPIYTMSHDNTLIEYYALPAIKLTLDWIKTEPTVLCESVFTTRLQIWPSLCKLLNSLQTNIGEADYKTYDKLPLPEDRDLQCFLPLVNAFKELDFTPENHDKDSTFYNKIRIVKLVNHGLWLANQSVGNGVIITAQKSKNPTKVVFEPANKQPDPTTELLEELKHFNIKDTEKGIKKNTKGAEKKGGILKPQGSLEKAREEREQALLLVTENSENNSSGSLSNTSINSAKSDTVKSKRTRQNVAMQALAKKVEENNKQVTFQAEVIVKTKEKPPKSQETIKSIPEVSIAKLISGKNNSDDILSPVMETTRIQQNTHITMPMNNIPIGIGSKPNEILNSGYQNVQNQAAVPLGYSQNQNVQNFPRPQMNVSNVPFSVPYQNNSTNLPHYSNLPPQHSNISYPRQPFTPTSNIPNNQNPNFNIFDVNLPTNPTFSNPQTSISSKDQFSHGPWMRDEKLPLPPSTWWANNQKPRFTGTTQTQSDIFNQPFLTNSYNMNAVNNTNINYIQDNLKPANIDFNRQYNTGIGNNSVYNNMSIWNSPPNVQPNLQMMLNQGGQPLMQVSQPQKPNFTDIKMPNMTRETPSMGVRDINDGQNNSMPGYSLFNSNWAPNLTVHSALKNNSPERSPSGPSPLLRQQSLFSGPGPSPLERLLEQQKQLRGNKEDT